MGLGRAIGSGLQKAGMNTVNPYMNPYQGKLLSFGNISMAGMALGGGAGALAGSWGDQENSLAGAGIGAAVGGLTPFTLGAVGALGVKGASAMYKNPVRALGGFGGAASLGGVGAAVGAIGGPLGSIIGGTVGAASGAVGGAMKPGLVGRAIGIPAVVAGVGVGAAGVTLAKGAGQSALRYANAGLSLAGSVLKYTPERTYFDEGKNKLVTKRGKMSLNWKRAGAVAGLASIVAAPKLLEKGFDELADMRAGQNAGVQRATPNYLDNAGATGDLVFAMHQNRRG